MPTLRRLHRRHCTRPRTPPPPVQNGKYYQLLMRPKGRRKGRSPICAAAGTLCHSQFEVNRMDRSLPTHSRSRGQGAAPGVRIGVGRLGAGRRGRARASAIRVHGAAESRQLRLQTPLAVRRLVCRHRRSRQAGGREHLTSPTAAPQGRAAKGQPEALAPKDMFPGLPDDHPLQRVLQELAAGVPRPARRRRGRRRRRARAS